MMPVESTLVLPGAVVNGQASYLSDETRPPGECREQRI